MGKILFIFTLLLMFLAASFAYSGGQQQEDEGGVIQYWTSQSEPNIKATFERLFDEFETQSGYEVVQTYVPNDQVALKWAAAAGSGKLPDVFNTTPHSLVTYGVTGQLEHLDDIVNDFEGWYPAMIRDVEYDGHYYAIPWREHYIWGATAGMLKGLADRLSRMGGQVP